MTVLADSHSGKFIISGSELGAVRLQPTAAVGGADTAAPSGRPKYWEHTAHLSTAGAVTGAAMSFDDHYCLTCGRDGGLFVFRAEFPESYVGPEQEGAAQTVPKAAAEETTEADDITLPSFYCIEEAKQKTEEDNLIQAAEEKKAAMRRHLQEIRDEFHELLRANERRAEGERLDAGELEIDPGLRAMIEVETNDKMEVARKELQWESEKKAVGLRKLKAWFLDPIEVERIVLRPFMEQFQVTTFRTPKLPDGLLKEIAEVHAVLAREEAAAAAAAAESGGGGGGGGGGAGARERVAMQPERPRGSGGGWRSRVQGRRGGGGGAEL